MVCRAAGMDDIKEPEFLETRQFVYVPLVGVVSCKGMVAKEYCRADFRKEFKLPADPCPSSRDRSNRPA
jgi:hypothetical protein